MYTTSTASIYYVGEAKQPRTGGIKMQKWTIPFPDHLCTTRLMVTGILYMHLSHATTHSITTVSKQLSRTALNRHSYYRLAIFNCIYFWYTVVHTYYYRHIYCIYCIYIYVRETKQPRTGGIKMQDWTIPFPEPSAHKFYSTRLMVTGILYMHLPHVL